MKAKVANFYGWTNDEINNLPISIFNDYFISITPIIAEQQLMAFEANTFPHIKKEQRRNAIGKYKRMLSMYVDKTGGKLATIKDVAKAFARMMHG